MAFDTRIQNSGGGDFDAATSHKIMMNSRGFTGEYRRCYCGFSAQPIAHDDDGNMQRNYWYSVARTIAPARRPRRHRPRSRPPHPAPSRRAPRADPASPRRLLAEIARSIIGNIFDAANGDAIYRHASFFAGMLGEHVAGENITVIDDGTLVFDDCRRQHHRRLRHLAPSTAKACPPAAPSSSKTASSRTTSSTPTPRASSAWTPPATPRAGSRRTPASAPATSISQPGTLTPEQIIADVPNGLYVTETMGFGVNLVTGDYSQGASGLWIENGELAYPVEEITIAGNLKDMYQNISAIGNDLDLPQRLRRPHPPHRRHDHRRMLSLSAYGY